MKNLYISAAVAAMIALPGMASAAVILLDDFETIQRSGDQPSDAFPKVTTLDSGSFVADTRTLESNNMGSPSDLNATTLVTNGALSFSNDDRTNGTATASYTFDAIDLSAITSFSIDVVSYDLSEPAATDFSLTIDGETMMASLMKSLVGSTITFSGFTAANLASVSDVVLSFGPSSFNSVDTSVDNFRANVSEVPLPAGAVLLLTGLAGLGFARRKA